MTTCERRALTEALGTDPGSFGVYEDLTSIPDAVCDTARGLPESLRLPFFRFITAGSEHRWLPWFVDDVLIADSAPETFGRDGVLVVSASLEELLRIPVAQLLGRLAGSGTWVGFPPEETWWGEFAGAVGRRRLDLGYRWQPPPGVARIHVRDPLPTVDDPALRTRRWLAARMAAAMDLGMTLEPGPFLSPDATISLAALRREQQSPTPGFTGPDSWYERENGAWIVQ